MGNPKRPGGVGFVGSVKGVVMRFTHSLYNDTILYRNL